MSDRRGEKLEIRVSAELKARWDREFLIEKASGRVKFQDEFLRHLLDARVSVSNRSVTSALSS